jgi:HSP20 family molecular chaperone IbpA
MMSLKHSIQALALATLLIIPGAKAWNIRPSFLNKRQAQLMDPSYQQQWSQHPCRHHYELVSNEEKFQLTIEVPGVKIEDINVALGEGFVTVCGGRSLKDENSWFCSKFSQTFPLDRSVQVENLKATLKNGVLEVSAPKEANKLEGSKVKIPVSVDGSEEGGDQLENVKIIPYRKVMKALFEDFGDDDVGV